MREQERLQSLPGLLQIILGAYPRTGQIAKRFVLDPGDVHGRQITSTQCTRQLDRVTSVRFDALTGFLGDQ
ncbi:hypothetical protein A7U58_19570 [Burkholderia pseudomallei]|nr:hypothetical protein A7U58_03295 [Burkholderia pseudomallei]EEH24896.1 hypothetical protein BUH_6236 [Burkholderia pseudomallei Pakistan 9]ANW52374.1 hypothetical protein A7U58_19570 [Burkholderia pseudomallei]ANW55229.1 hypothetical protein A7U59_03310 [Burkholderia pseudomallei]ANW58359.1 hypothetical protein A7U59_19520 [Burkholderia pseudomallei]